MRRFLLPAIFAAAALGGAAAAAPLNQLAFECQEGSERGMTDPATLRICNQAVRVADLSPRERAATYLNRGVIYIARGSERLAVADFEEAVRLDPGLAEAHVNLGLARLANLDHQAAITSLTEGVNLAPREPAKAYYGRGLAYEGLGQLQQAQADYQRAAALAPNWDLPRRDLARVATLPAD